MILGIIFGVITAFLQDIGYFFARFYIQDGNKPNQLFIHSQLIMGILSLPILLILWLVAMPTSWTFILPLILTCVGSGGGQLFFMKASKNVEATRISSLMGMRVILLAMFSAIIFDTQYNIGEVSGILLAAVSAVLINRGKSHFKLHGLTPMFIALIFYCMSDLSVAHLVLVSCQVRKRIKTDKIKT